LSPSGSLPGVPADGTSTFTIMYSLFDSFGNPASQQLVWVNTSIPSEEHQYTSNSLGQIAITYGPKSSVGVVTITATSVTNSSVTISQEVEFTSAEAANIELTANPEIMASRDVNPANTADITATVIDDLGNPVEGEIVTFSLGTVEYPGGPYEITSAPSLTSTTATTDADGRATVQFIPGSFSTINSMTATGTVTITAAWNSNLKNLVVTWKNYPYLSVKTSVQPLIVTVNETVNISIAIVGDGWALQTTPIDVVMCTDRSGSMLYNGTDGIIDDRMVHAIRAGKIFNANMGLYDRVGLVSFGDNSATSGWAELRQGYSHQYTGAQWVSKDDTWTGDITYITKNYPGNPRNYGTTQYASIDQNLIFSRTTVNASISNMVPAGSTPMREALYRSVKMLIDDPRSNTQSAVVLLTDGAWNTGGNPQGGTGATSFGVVGTGSVITWAKNNNIRIYTIRLGTEPSQSELMAYATETGGKYYNAPTADQLDAIYTSIAGDLKDNAGVNTIMTVDLENVNVTGVTMPGNQVFDYVYLPTASTKINWQNGITNVTDQSADWVADNKLDFTIGTIKAGQSWNATFRLKANQSGSIDIFGTNSLISFNEGASSLNLPSTYLTVVPNIIPLESKTLTLKNLLITEPGEITSTLPVMWNTTYTGNKTITERVYYSVDTGPWVLFSLISHNYPYAPDIISTTEYVDFAQLDVSQLPPGSYRIQVYATAADTPDQELVTNAKIVGEGDITSLTANPEIVTSRDVPPSNIASDIIALVVDRLGNAVDGENVTFSLANITYEAAYNVTADPSLSSTSNITDVYGMTSVRFIPGNFTTLGNPGYNATAIGHCEVIATWKGISKTVPVTWKNYPYIMPFANFSSNVTTGTAPLAVKFTDTSTGTGISSWSWDFNNNGIVDSEIQCPEYIFNLSGVYTINLTITNVKGSSSLIRTNYINVTAPAPLASFTVDVTEGNAPLDVVFTDTSANTPNAWNWSFRNVTGNNSEVWFSSVQNPSHTFGVGNYSIVLDASNSAGYNFSSQVIFINVSTAIIPPVASFTVDVTEGTAPLDIVFTDTSANTPNAWNWSFRNVTGNNSEVWFSTGQNPSHTFGVGNYSIVLNASNSAGYNLSSQVTFINVTAAPIVVGNDGIAIFRNSSGYWYFDHNLYGIINKSFRYGGVGDQIIKGDWNGTGRDEIAIFRSASGYWYFDFNLDGIVDKSFRYGGSTDLIITGKWHGPNDGIAIFRPSTGYWYFDYNLDGIVDKSFRYGGSTDLIITGKWHGPNDGITIFRPSTGYWYLDYNLDGIVDKSFRYGGVGDQIIKGDWDGDGKDGIAIFRPASGYWYFDYNLDGIVDNSFRYGGNSDQIIAGKWA